MTTLRIGVLGAARVASYALLEPACHLSGVSVHAIASRGRSRAEQLAGKCSIPVVHDSYEDLLGDPDIDAVYIPLPNGLHGRWTIAALKAGKHVLCEKPFAANAEEAEQVAEVARSSGLVTMEAFHYRYHGLMNRLLEIIASGELGELRHIHAHMCFPLIRDDIRWHFELAGGALMDAGCYTIHMLRTLAGGEPTVVRASAKLRSPNVDRLFQAEFEFANGCRGSLLASMLSMRLLGAGLRITGSKGRVDVFNPLAPQYYHRVTVRSGRGRRREAIDRQPSSYRAQLQVFVDAVQLGTPIATGVDDAVANMRVIDACYVAAGLPRRMPS